MATNNKAVIGGLVGAIALAVSLVVPFEGKENRAYYDPPKIATICYGHTGGVKITDTATDEQCEKYLEADLKIAEAAVDSLVTVKISDETKAAFIDFVYNAGKEKFRKSIMLKKLNAGDIEGACNELSKWVYAGGQKLPGLVRRREAERQLCLKGI